MKNFEVARQFELMADVLELRGENPSACGSAPRDGVVTEMLDGWLQEQQEVVLGVTAPAPPPAVPAGGPRLRF